MTDYPQRITAADQLVTWFGYWPSFHDAEIQWIKLARGFERLQGDVQVEFLVHKWELIKAGNELKSQKHCLIHFGFKHCADIKLSGFNQQNQLGTISFSTEKQVLPPHKVVPTNAVTYIEAHRQSVVDEILTVAFISEFGVSGGFRCYAGEVLGIEACDKGGNPIPMMP